MRAGPALIAPILLSLPAIALAADKPAEPPLTHYMTGISVADMAGMTLWYVEKLGFTVTNDQKVGNAGAQVRILERDGERIELIAVPGSKPGPERDLPPAHALLNGFTHIALETPDLAATRIALAARGVTPAMPESEVAALGVKILFLRDPEGNLIAVVQRIKA